MRQNNSPLMLGVISTKMQILYPIDWDERDNFEQPAKGWLEGVVVTLDDNTKHELSFYDLVRFKQEFEHSVSLGKTSYIVKGLIIVPSVTKENIEFAIEQAIKEGYFV